jgi:S-adenosylmethionine uptake transporter
VNRVAQQAVPAFLTALVAVAALSIMDAVMKHLVLVIGILAVSVWRAGANLILSSAMYLPRRGPWPAWPTMRIHIARAVIVTAMAFMFFWGISRIPLAQGIALTFIAPLISMLLASVFLKEKIGGGSLAGSALAFAGVVVIVAGEAREELGADALLGVAAILGSALTYAVNIVLMRHQALAAKPLEINFFQSLTIMACWLALLIVTGVPALPNGQWHWIAVASVLSTAGTLLFAWAYARGTASYLAVTEYSAFLWAAALGWIVFRESVSLYTIAGAVLIVSGCLIAARTKRLDPPEIDVAA